MITANKVGLGLLCHCPVLFQMLNLVSVGCSKICNHAPVVASNDDTTSTGWLLLVVTISDSKASLLVCVLQNICILVLANAAKEDHRVGLEQVLRTKGIVSLKIMDIHFDTASPLHEQPGRLFSMHIGPSQVPTNWAFLLVSTYLSSSCCVLSCTSCQQLRIAVLDQLLVKCQVLLLSEDGVVCLQAILLKKCVVTNLTQSA